MSQVHCCELLPLASGIICHGFQESTNRLLIFIRYGSELANQLFFRSAKKLTQWSRSPTGEHISRINTTLFKCGDIAKIKRACSQFVVLLRAPANPEQHSKISLI